MSGCELVCMSNKDQLFYTRYVKYTYAYSCKLIWYINWVVCHGNTKESFILPIVSLVLV